MTGRRSILGAVAAALVLPAVARARSEDHSGPAAGTEAPRPSWGFGVSIAGYLLPREADYLQPTVTIDRGSLHLESRYNYEGRETFSLFIGWNLALGTNLKLDLAPMLGGVVGRTQGIAPGLELTLAWGILELHSENEYVIDTANPSSSFFFAWSELSVSPIERLRFGLVMQRTRVFRTPREVQLGPLIGVSVWKIDATFYLFNPRLSDQFAVVAVGSSF